MRNQYIVYHIYNHHTHFFLCNTERKYNGDIGTKVQSIVYHIYYFLISSFATSKQKCITRTLIRSIYTPNNLPYFPFGPKFLCFQLQKYKHSICDLYLRTQHTFFTIFIIIVRFTHFLMLSADVLTRSTDNPICSGILTC